ncbi:SDR family oxidoreductase [Zhouia amylolytica]|uniref:Oxidoreductase, short chain dehydrogenase/reductase family n=1 Tax=Zhouia amylolytica AD3 TaxID=1286632 RepID=W2UQK3_9FLAO|nr:SDR family oxidoreductase [Zhouia amylolytica]ETN95602.1 oxidoreductase, short chain dehydrogenase/reductase family [Zhouia amylolytica AD3]MCQ0110795.1 SDR family oxidoreductase [Zhouia amylolytica]
MSKVVLITGGSSGIGKSIAEFLTNKGFVVYGTSRNPDRVKEDLSFNLVRLDVGDTASIQSAVDTIVSKEKRLDIVINNAGVGITGPIEETPREEIHKVFSTNLYGPIEVMKAVLPPMRKQKQGLIINITSIAGYMGLPYRGLYSASKGALELVTEAMRMETKDFGVQITNLAPGDFATNIASGRYHAPVLTGSPYEKPYGDTLNLINEHVDDGGDPNDVAETVYKIINTTKPKVHYKVGAFMQKFSIVLKNILPDKVYEKLLLNHYKL